MTDRDCPPEDRTHAQAIEYYQKAVAEREAAGEEVCRVCAAAGWMMMERSSYAAILDSMTEDDPEYEEVVDRLALLHAKNLPSHFRPEGVRG